MWERELMDRVAQVLFKTRCQLRCCSTLSCDDNGEGSATRRLYHGSTSNNNNVHHRSPENKKDDNNPPPLLIPPQPRLLDDNHHSSTRRTALKKKGLELQQEESPTKKKKAKTTTSIRNLAAAADLPEALKNRIVETGGCLDDLVLVIEKELYESDVNRGQNRLSLPYKKVNIQFLTLEERDNLDQPKAEIQATLIEPCLRECGIRLRSWKSNSMLALVNPWNEVCRRNRLEKGNVVQLWSFRRNSDLCFVLLPIQID